MKKLYITSLYCILTTLLFSQAGYMGKTTMIAINPLGLMDYNTGVNVEIWKARTRFSGFVLNAGISHMAQPPADVYEEKNFSINLNDSQTRMYDGIVNCNSSFTKIKIGADFVYQNGMVGMAIPIGYFIRYGFDFETGSFAEKGLLEYKDYGPGTSFATKFYNYSENYRLYQFSLRYTLGRNFLIGKTYGFGVGISYVNAFSFSSKDQFGQRTGFAMYGGNKYLGTTSNFFDDDPYLADFGFKVAVSPYITAFVLLK